MRGHIHHKIILKGRVIGQLSFLEEKGEILVWEYEVRVKVFVGGVREGCDDIVGVGGTERLGVRG